MTLALLFLMAARAGASSVPPAPAVAVSPAPPAGPIAAEVVSDVSAFSLDPQDIAEGARAVPAPDSRLGQKVLALMRRVYYLPGSVPAPSSSRLAVATWNVDDPLDAGPIARVSSVLAGRVDALDQAGGEVR